jgi:hypothetical protein
LGEPAYVTLARESEVGQFEAGAAIDEDLISAVDQDIRYTRLPEQRLQNARSHAVPPQRLHCSKHRRVTHGKALGSHGNCHITGRVIAAEPGQAITDEGQRRVVDIEIGGQVQPTGHVLTSAFSCATGICVRLPSTSRQSRANELRPERAGGSPRSAATTRLGSSA